MVNVQFFGLFTVWVKMRDKSDVKSVEKKRKMHVRNFDDDKRRQFRV